MSKAAELAKIGEAVTNGQIGGRRNIAYNGAMNVAQRSASVTGIGASAGYFTLDRWYLEAGATAGRLTMTQTADGPVGFANCMKLDCTTADTSIAAGELLVLQQHIEGQDVQAIGKGVSGAKEVTLSFYVKANAAFDFNAEIQDQDNGRTNGKLFATTTDWVRHEITFEADADDGSSPFDDDNAKSLSVNFWLHGGSTFTSGTLASGWENTTNANRAAGIDSFYSNTNNNFFITGLQLEVGSVATPFEHRSFGEELHLCSRYYTRDDSGSGANYKRFAHGQNQSTTVAGFMFLLTTPLRATPAIEGSGAANHYTLFSAGQLDTCTALSLVGDSNAGTHNNSISFQASVSSGLATGDATAFLANNKTDTFLAFDAEL